MQQWPWLPLFVFSLRIRTLNSAELKKCIISLLHLEYFFTSKLFGTNFFSTELVSLTFFLFQIILNSGSDPVPVKTVPDQQHWFLNYRKQKFRIAFYSYIYNNISLQINTVLIPRNVMSWYCQRASRVIGVLLIHL